MILLFSILFALPAPRPVRFTLPDWPGGDLTARVRPALPNPP
ncbi:hypothetical protein [Thalassobius vesicularis]|nr:hypothetical protein [Thalassobius vesicularis]